MDTHYVYVLAERENQQFGAVKIGLAVDPEKRLGELQTGNPRQLLSLGTFGPIPERHARRLEQFWQWMFQFDHIRGYLLSL